ncbi:MAG: menaquinone biosynthesis decarboxylase [Bacteroidales bacterium]|nr:menaquinone biosynthesis decarboxylase [Bacteroidales bacterium]
MQHFIELLRGKGELIEISEYVNPELEITEIVDRLSKSNTNKALLFTNNGTSFPLLINAFGTEQRIAYALHANSLYEVEENIQSLFQILKPPKTIKDKWSLILKLAKIGSYMPKFIKRKGKCQQVVHFNPDLNILPILKCWPHDGGKFITLPLVHTKDAIDGKRNVGMYRMQVFSNNTTGMHWHIHKTGALHFDEYKKQGKKIPVAVCLGGDPVYTYCATAPLPEGIDEYILAGLLRKKKVKLVRCLTQNIEVPEDADIVIEGYIDPNEPLANEGPFGDHTGFYSLTGLYPIFHITAITHKKDAIYPATIVGIPPQEDYGFIKASERIFLQFLKNTLLPEIIDMRMPAYGVAHNLVLTQIKPRYPQHAAKVAHALWGIGQMMLNKILIITNEPIDLPEKLFKKIITLESWADRIQLSFGPLDVLEHSGLKPTEGGKMFFDAVFNHSTQFTENMNIENIVFSYKPIYTNFLSYGILILFVEPEFDVFKHSIFNELKQINRKEVRVFLVDKNLEGLDWSYIAWHFMANFDPSVDFNIIENKILIFNGSIKINNQRITPNTTISNKETIDIIDKKWSSLLPLSFIKSPSLILKKLNYGDGYLASLNKNESNHNSELKK